MYRCAYKQRNVGGNDRYIWESSEDVESKVENVVIRGYS